MLVVSDRNYYPLPGSDSNGNNVFDDDIELVDDQINVLKVSDPLDNYLKENDIEVDFGAVNGLKAS